MELLLVYFTPLKLVQTPEQQRIDKMNIVNQPSKYK